MTFNEAVLILASATIPCPALPYGTEDFMHDDCGCNMTGRAAAFPSCREKCAGIHDVDVDAENGGHIIGFSCPEVFCPEWVVAQHFGIGSVIKDASAIDWLIWLTTDFYEDNIGKTLVEVSAGAILSKVSHPDPDTAVAVALARAWQQKPLGGTDEPS